MSKLNEYYGLVHCFVSAPPDLTIPLLPYRTKAGRLTFPLCARCVETHCETCINHPLDWRGWDGVYTTPELNKAVELGYKIHVVYEFLNVFIKLK